MRVKLEKTIRRNAPSTEWDVKQLKKALNRLGYYSPDAEVGINGTPDQRLFAGITQYQKDYGLKITETITPDGETIQRLNTDLQKTPDGYYIWRTVEDGKTRNTHAAYNRTLRAWADSPDPGEDFNCRCWAEHINQNAYCADIQIQLANAEVQLYIKQKTLAAVTMQKASFQDKIQQMERKLAALQKQIAKERHDKEKAKNIGGGIGLVVAGLIGAPRGPGTAATIAAAGLNAGKK